jgi:glycine C-acetyltransferase
MPHERLETVLQGELAALAAAGRRKGAETVITAIVPAAGERGPRYRIAGEGERAFLRMNANNYLGLSLHADVIAAAERAAREFGTGPGAARFISGTFAVHAALERRLAAFHGRPAAMAYTSAYAAVMGVLPPLVTPQTAVISDALNHNSIINAVRLARPAARHVYRHLDLAELAAALAAASTSCRRAIVVTDGVFSMRGDHAPLCEIVALARRWDAAFAENVVVVVDDSHGVGAFGATGRGTEEVTGCPPVDVLIGTLGKAFGVNGGYVAAAPAAIEYLRETSPFYVYSNPLSPGEAAAAAAAVDVVDGARGREMLAHLRAMTVRFRDGLAALGLESIAGAHPIVPLLVRDTARTAAVVRALRARGVLATGLGYPVVPRGEEEIRFQICADHTPADIDAALDALRGAWAAGAAP